jgi:PAS domain S-box-containing protein
MDPIPSSDEERVLVLAPTAADAAMTRSILGDAGLSCRLSSDLRDLAAALAVGAGALLITEEALAGADAVNDLVDALRDAPAWSDVPILLLAASRTELSERAQMLERVCNVTVLERPVHLRPLLSSLRAALRARRRQYQVRDQMLAIESGKRQLDDIFENASVGLHCVGPDGTILRANQTELDMLGYTREEYVGRPIERFHADPAVIRDIMAQLLAGGRVNDCEARLVCKNGAIKHVRISSSALWQDGEFVHTRCFTRDVTETRRAERALYESEERLRVAQQAAHSGVFDHDFTTGRTYWSPELETLYGIPPSAERSAEADRTWVRRIHPADRERVRESVRAALESGEYAQDFRVVWPDDSVRWLHTRAGVVFDDARKPLRMLGVQIDVTEAKRAERTRALLAGIVESSDDAMVTKSLEGIITSWNVGAERIFGYTAQEVIGRSIKVVIPADRHAEEDEILARVRSGQRVDHYETVRLTKDGRAIDVSLTVSPVRDDRGEIVGVSKVARDVTERKAVERVVRASEAALRDADRRKDEFLAMLAHELRNPLAPIRNAVDLIAARPAATTTLDQVHDILDRQVGHLSRLVDDLLDVSRISRGQIQIAKDALVLSTIVEMAIETARPLIESRRHAFRATLPDEPIHVRGDRVRLVQVIGNLLTNAAKFTPPGGTVTLTARRTESEVTIAVRDDGVGIAPEALSRVFDLFAQEEPSIARTQGGLGIGLTLVRDLVALHGGRVEVESEGRGRGAEFRVSLPTSTDEAVVAARRESKRPTSPLRILIAEDHRDTADSLRLLLERQGHLGRVARDGREAVTAFGELQPDVALLDIGLPELDGYAVARGIRAGEGDARAVLIALSGYGRADDKRAAKQAGFDHHLTKPVDVRQLVGLFPSR